MSMEAALAESVRRLADTNPCEDDDEGYCIAHQSDAPCAHAQALDLLAQYDARIDDAEERAEPLVPHVDHDTVLLLELLSALVAGDACQYDSRGRCIAHDHPSANFDCPNHRAAVLIGRLGG